MAFILVVIALAGCGGGDDDASGGSSTEADAGKVAEVPGSAGMNGPAGVESPNDGRSGEEGGSSKAGRGSDADPGGQGSSPSDSGGESNGGSGREEGATGKGTAKNGAAAKNGGNEEKGDVVGAPAGQPSAQTTSRSQFVERANAVCAKTAEQVQGELRSYLTRSVSKTQGEEEVFAEITKEIVSPALNAEIEEIRALGYPPGDAAELEAIFTGMLEVLAKMKADPPTFVNAENPFEESEKRAQIYGIGACGGL